MLILDQILARSKEKLQLRISITSQKEIEDRARKAAAPKGFTAALQRREGPMKIVAELRRATPFRGALRPQLDAVQFAQSCATGGAGALSVCVEEEYFKGSNQDFIAVRKSVELPILHRDFITESYQIYEARYLGADALSLNCALLKREKLRDFLTTVKDLGMTGVVEIGEEKDLGTALAAGAAVLRIDDKDPRSMRPIPGKARKLRMVIPADIPLIVESEKCTKEELAYWEQEKNCAFLISEPLILAPDPESKLRELLA